MDSEFKVQLDYLSFVKMCALIGFCAGVIFIPLNFLQFLLIDDRSIDVAFMYLLLSVPLLGSFLWAFTGVLSYPVYYYLTKRVSFSYRGKLYVRE